MSWRFILKAPHPPAPSPQGEGEGFLIGEEGTWGGVLNGLLRNRGFRPVFQGAHQKKLIISISLLIFVKNQNHGLFRHFSKE